ncbi:hypothetical protein [Streptococcus sp. zg-JUN1979]|uniref:hypothetical protein n=1 Tax=Streptococcus sp. zg-JUN1979 TaxID=3391450 RepID=UPI0039A5715B
MTPSHAIFRQVFNECLAIHEDTYDFLPDASAHYPFFFVGEGQFTESENLELYGECVQTVHLYGLRQNRSGLDELTAQLLDRLKDLRETFDYQVSFKTANPRDMIDNTDVQPLIHRVLDVRFSYVKK